MYQSIGKIIFFLVLVCVSMQAAAFSRGIYLTQPTAQDARKISYFIQQAKSTGIDTFIIDAQYRNSRYADNVRRVVNSGIRYVARVVVFPDGGTDAQVTNRQIWEKRLALIKYAVGLGAHDIQLDYIRYSYKSYSSKQKVHRIATVARYFKNALSVPIQVDIFGVAAHGPSHTIGQDVPTLAPIVDAFCPMVYPSHYEPYRHHAVRPYQTVLKSVLALKQQLKPFPHVKVYPYIELYNYRYPLSHASKLQYIAAQIEAVRASGANGWYAWSPTNRYGSLFQVLKRRS